MKRRTFCGGSVLLMMSKWWDVLTKISCRRVLLFIAVHIPIFSDQLIIQFIHQESPSICGLLYGISCPNKGSEPKIGTEESWEKCITFC